MVISTCKKNYFFYNLLFPKFLPSQNYEEYNFGNKISPHHYLKCNIKNFFWPSKHIKMWK